MVVIGLLGVRPTVFVTCAALLGLGCSSGKGTGAADADSVVTGGTAAGGATNLGAGTSGGAHGENSAGGTMGSGGTSGGAGASDAGIVTTFPDASAGGWGDTTRRDAMDDSALPKDGMPDVSLARTDTRDDVVTRGDADLVVPAGYKLVWSDEFDVDGKPNPMNWSYEKGFVRNNELQWYQPDNASVKDGLLVIEGRKERVNNPNYKAGSSEWKTSRPYAEYTSTSMTTSGLQTWQYGRLEMRGRIPTGPGMWPAWWTLGVKGEWPSNGEVDIMEYYNGKLLANVACGTDKQWTAKWDSVSKSLSSLGAGWSDKFHVWRMDWDDQKIDLSLDGTLLNTATLASMLNADGSSPFKQRVYMILNLAIGGDNGGDPSGTAFPVKYEVDYVRVFQRL